MGTVINILLSHDLPTKKQNELLYRLELARWKASWREAEEENDFDRMDMLHRDYERVGLP